MVLVVLQRVQSSCRTVAKVWHPRDIGTDSSDHLPFEAGIVCPSSSSQAQESRLLLAEQHTLAALDAFVPALSIDNLLKLARAGVKFIFVAIGADLASSHGRMKCEVARLLCAHNRDNDALGVVIMVDVKCCAHILHRETESGFSTLEFIPRLYSVSFSMSLPGTFSGIVQNLEAVVREDLALCFYPRLRPQAWRHNSTRGRSRN